MTTVTGAASADRLAIAVEAQRERLLPCVHCGFCLPACPTYNRLGDENDSPRGRLHLMKAVVEGRLDPASPAFQTHIDRCLGCRACEPVCPSGVEYGTLLELARATAADAKPPGKLTTSLLTVMGSRFLRRTFFLGGRIVRGVGLAALGAKILPARRPFANARLALAMLAATTPYPADRGPTRPPAAPDRRADETPPPGGTRSETRGTVAMLEGCVQAGLYAHLNRASARTLRANGYDLRVVPRQDCCGALHAHGGDLNGARRLARRNIEAFEAAGVDFVAANAAGCGAAMKEYGTLFEAEADFRERAQRFARSVRDVTELLADAGPMSGAAVACTVAYDHPCHLMHAQRVVEPPLAVLRAVPGVEVRIVRNADECCGGAGIYGMTHPDLGGRIGADKVAAVLEQGAEVTCTPNPGCMMQIGAGLRLRGEDGLVVHPVELLDESYFRAGIYG
jgi:glycolate oxidase iron-sulfur subunit